MSDLNLAHKIELNPNNKQSTYFQKACGVSRFAWNWGLDRWNNLYKAKQQLPKEVADTISISGMSLKKDFNAIKKEQFPWTKEVTKYAAQQPFIQLQAAWQRYFKSPKGASSGKPRFKKKNKSIDSFYIGGDQIKIRNKKIWVPNLGWVRMREPLRFEGKINSVTISHQANKWFASVQVKLDENSNQNKKVKSLKKCKTKKKVGVDLGVNKAVFLSDGSAIESPKPLKKNLRKLAKENRRLARKIRAAKKDKRKLKESKNFQKQKLKVQKLHAKIGNIRKDSVHKITNYITSNFKEIAIEDLYTKGMLKNQKLARAISDIGFGEIRRQFEYKSKLRGNDLLIVDRFFPSSKTCSHCGTVKSKNELKLSDRVFNCECGLKIDRDLNAAINLKAQLNLTNKIRPVRSKFKPVEITAMRLSVFPMIVTSIFEAGSELQTEQV